MKPPFLLLALLGTTTLTEAAPTAKPAAKPIKKPAAKPAIKPKPPAKKPPLKPGTMRPPQGGAQTSRPVVAEETGPKTWALLVGIGKYQSPQINALRFPAVDAAGVRDTLIDPRIGGLKASQVLLLADEDATREKILGAVNSFLRPNVKKGDKVIVFLAGHGVAKGVGLQAKSFLLPNDVKGVTTAALESSAVPLRRLSDDLATLPASQFVLFVDACREDPTPGRGIKGNTLSDVLSRNISVTPSEPNAQSATFFACSIGQRAFEDPTYGHGVFTNWILEGLKAGAVPQKPDGAVDMGRLSSYVDTKVKEWAKKTSENGDFEVEQTPELVATQLTQPLVLMRVKRDFSGVPIVTSPPKLSIAASPEGAMVSINGAHAGVGSVERTVPEGSYSISVSAPGYAPIARTVNALGGYEQQIDVQLEPLAGRSVGAPVGTPPMGAPVPAPDNRAAQLFAQAEQAAAREQWEIAEQGYIASLGADPRFTPAREALYELHRARNLNGEAIFDALALLSSGPKTASSLALLSSSYSNFAVKGAGDSQRTSTYETGGYKMPKNPADAAKLSQKAADEATKLDANSPAAWRSTGYALAALDTKAKNKGAALAAWGKAGFLDATDAENQLGLGYGIRFYAAMLPEARQAPEIARAIAALNEAVRLRPNFYEAHRELAFCYIALNQTDAALRECRLARSNRGGASDIDELAGIEIAMSGLHQKKADNSTGDVKIKNEAASQGYLSEAKDTSSNLEKALSILSAAGLSTSLSNYLPANLRPFLDLKGTLTNKIRNKVPGIPGLGKLPF